MQTQVKMIRQRSLLAEPFAHEAADSNGERLDAVERVRIVQIEFVRCYASKLHMKLVCIQPQCSLV